MGGADGFTVPIAGKYTATEEGILAQLYAHADEALGTKDLMRLLRPEQTTIEQQRMAHKEVQYGIETLISAGLVRGKRVPELESIYHVKLRLTPKGEAEAIKERRRLKTIIVDIPRPHWSKTRTEYGNRLRAGNNIGWRVVQAKVRRTNRNTEGTAATQRQNSRKAG